ncbi:YicC/YloC family endoribonuclease [Marinoscillum sp. MHG1-6]|uniref:YicC/YloC family endoribonuclease n=1 Tax=Marinoscillum sp. MHG1-6 TaxID=2959627 RepID=UPI002157271B|nr:YicC/YloC family endoribonuclease [Marinoscillum sp. MHG1-6]
MLLSMTGYGSAEVSTPQYNIKIEVKSLNSKFLDVILRSPRELADKELEIRGLIGQYLKRGKVNFSIEIQPTESAEPNVHINEALFNAYYSKYLELANGSSANTDEIFKLALQSPEVISSNDAVEFLAWDQVKSAIISALEKCNEFRAHEGKVLEEKFLEYVSLIREGLKQVSDQDVHRVELIRERLQAGLEDIKEKVQVDQNRFEQELIYYIEKLDITEEKVRLAKHLDHLEEVMGHTESEGKKMGFISQEIGREINTIGAKANDAVIQRAVVHMKDELEKIKEQSSNIL